MSSSPGPGGMGGISRLICWPKFTCSRMSWFCCSGLRVGGTGPFPRPAARQAHRPGSRGGHAGRQPRGADRDGAGAAGSGGVDHMHRRLRHAAGQPLTHIRHGDLGAGTR